jgi:hypothetical protein
MSKTFQPDSLHPYIMDERLKKATGSGGISDIPIASAETLGGIKVPADSGITIDGSGAISVTYDITTTEVNTHEKYNGKDIYALNIHSDNGFALVANTQVSIVELSAETLIDAKAYETTGLAVPKSAVVDNGTFKFEAFGSFIVHDFIVKYTKPTTP